MGARRPGWVGRPLPGVETKVDLHATKEGDIAVGDLKVKGPNVFSEYWNKPQATRDTFDSDVLLLLYYSFLRSFIIFSFILIVSIGLVCYR